MKKNILIAFFLIISICLGPLAAQEIKKEKKTKAADLKAAKTWVKIFSSPALDIGYSIQQTSDGGYAVAGLTFFPSLQRPDLWILRLDFKGNKIWEKRFQNAVHGQEEYVISQGHDGGFWILTQHDIGKGFLSRVVVRVIKLDSRGEVLFDKDFTDFTADKYFTAKVGFSLLAVPEGGCLVGGYRNKGGVQVPWLMKLDDRGNVLWEQVMDGTGPEPVTAIAVTPDNHFIAVTSGWSTKGFRFMKLNSNGDLIWSRTYYSGNDTERVRSIAMTPDGGFVVAGETGRPSFNGFIMKLNDNGELQWDREVNSTGRVYAQPTNDGGFLAVTSTKNYKMRKVDVLVSKFDNKGNVLWSKTIGEQGASYHISALDRASDGGFVLTGGKARTLIGTDMDLMIMKIDASGQIGKLKTVLQPLGGKSKTNIFKRR